MDTHPGPLDLTVGSMEMMLVCQYYNALGNDSHDVGLDKHTVSECYFDIVGVADLATQALHKSQIKALKYVLLKTL